MKALMILGAVIGFLIGGGLALASHNPWPAVFWRACAATLVAAVLTRWWGGIWLRGLGEMLDQRRHCRPVLPLNPQPKANL